jgi:hypothetical protein
MYQRLGGNWVLAAMKRGRVQGLGRSPRIPKAHCPYGLRRLHVTPLGIEDEYKKGRFQFCFVRRPYEWYRSFWCYRSITAKLDPGFALDICWNNDFETFLENTLTIYPKGFLTQVYQYYVGSDNSQMNFVGRQENLFNDLITALTLAGETEIDVKRIRRLKPMNVSAGLPQFGDITASSSLIKQVEDVEYWILDTFYTEAS